MSKQRRKRHTHTEHWSRERAHRTSSLQSNNRTIHLKLRRWEIPSRRSREKKKSIVSLRFHRVVSFHPCQRYNKFILSSFLPHHSFRHCLFLAAKQYFTMNSTIHVYSIIMIKRKKIVKNTRTTIMRFVLSSYSRNTRAVRYESASNANVFIVSRVSTQRIYYTDRVQTPRFQDSSHIRRRFLIVNHGAHFPYR